MTITAAADGSALGNPGPAGWAWYVDDNCWAAGGWKHATNNQGELMAVLEFFRATAHLNDDVLLLCDSQYVINSITKWMPGWKKKGWRKSDGKPVLNLELLQEIDDAIVGRRYRFEWVKGHANHPLNEAADLRARAVSEAYQRGLNVPGGPGWFRTGDTLRSLATATVSPKLSAVATATAAATATATATDDDEATDEAPRGTLSPTRAAVDLGTVSQPQLFDFDEPAELIDVTVALSADVHARLLQLAKSRGVSIEDALRDLI